MKTKPVKPGEILFIPQDNRLLESSPYVNSVSSLPMWFKKIGKQPGSVRRCAGTIDLLAAGITLPAWTNFRFRPNVENKEWEHGADDFYPQANINQVQGFSYDSTGSCPMTDIRKIETGQYPKLVNPWRIKTAPGWSTLMIPTYWEPNENYTVVPAIVNTDIYHLMNVVLNLTGDSPFEIPFGTPLAQLIPFRRDADFGKIIMEDEKNFKYYATSGFGMGHVSPSSNTSALYRRISIKTDNEIRAQKNSKRFRRNRNATPKTD